VGVVIRGVQPEEMALDPATAGESGHSRSAARVEALFRQHYGRMVSMLARLTGDRSHSEEIASDVFHKLSQRPALLTSGDDLAAWKRGLILIALALNLRVPNTSWTFQILDPERHLGLDARQ